MIGSRSAQRDEDETKGNVPDLNNSAWKMERKMLEEYKDHCGECDIHEPKDLDDTSSFSGT